MSKSFPIQSAYQRLLSRGRLSTNPGQAALVERLANLQQSLSDTTSDSAAQSSQRENGVYIYGDVGTGKSRIADLFAATLPPNVSRRRIHFLEFMMETHMRVHRAQSKADYRGDPLVKIGQEICRESRVLCFDEFQVSDIADAMILKRLFGAFWDGGGVMVSTSNRHPTRLYENGLNRPLFVPFIHELQRRCEVWKLEGQQDYRMSAPQEQNWKSMCFFVDEGQFLASLREATGDCPLTSTTVRTVANRDLVVQACASKSKTRQSGKDDRPIVHATFQSLCEASLSSIDYHSLCKFASTVYLSGLRQFAKDEFDFIRRFITLVDVAYEYKTRLVCHSTVPLAKVFMNVIVPPEAQQSHEGKPLVLEAQGDLRKMVLDNLRVKGEGGSSSSMMSTFIGDIEWSATGLKDASLATGGAGETDVRFAIGRAISRLFEMNSKSYGVVDD